ncbi:MAG: hypothetical protein GY720_18785 [bacterium]|nr:hypothetical protein [bacterium]
MPLQLLMIGTGVVFIAVGIWAIVRPHSFFRVFPTFGSDAYAARAKRHLPNILVAVGGFAVVAGFLNSAGDLALPDRTSADVQAEEQRIAALLESTTDIWIPGECNVRLLGQEGSTSYAWADCSDGLAGTSLPLRIDTEQVAAPGDGSIFSDDVTTMFPSELAEAILARDERIFP